MGKIYARKIINAVDESYTIVDVPKMWYQKTIDAFKELVQSGEITGKQFKQYTGITYKA